MDKDPDSHSCATWVLVVQGIKLKIPISFSRKRDNFDIEGWPDGANENLAQGSFVAIEYWQIGGVDVGRTAGQCFMRVFFEVLKNLCFLAEKEVDFSRSDI
ncbi:hypothetical protein MRB53_022791 [Persea americana]|uniref:Uncharacterized protein n=1 Tax=Persea americana TaxID=3435 RepID=A0ACC2L846_PERAE|nr:hypothetical protein MRB53_022791 [Persea americana]